MNERAFVLTLAAALPLVLVNVVGALAELAARAGWPGSDSWGAWLFPLALVLLPLAGFATWANRTRQRRARVAGALVAALGVALFVAFTVAAHTWTGRLPEPLAEFVRVAPLLVPLVNGALWLLSRRQPANRPVNGARP